MNRFLETVNNMNLTLANDALLMAARIGWPETIARLLDLGASMDARDHYGRNPLMLAALEGETAAVEMLMSRGADVNARDYGGETPLMLSREHPTIIRGLILAGADVHMTDYNGATALMGAPAYSSQLLLNRGANANVEDRWGGTPLSFAIDRGQEDVAELLLSRGADPNRSNQFGETPFMRAVRNSRWQEAKLCWEFGGQIDTLGVGRIPRLPGLRMYLRSLTLRRRRI